MWDSLTRPNKSLARKLQCAAQTGRVYDSVLTLPGKDFECYDYLMDAGHATKDTRFAFVERNSALQDEMQDYADMWEFTTQPLFYFDELATMPLSKLKFYRAPHQTIDLANLDLCGSPDNRVFLWIERQLQHHLTIGSVISLTVSRNRRSNLFGRLLWSLDKYDFLQKDIARFRSWLSSSGFCGSIKNNTLHRDEYSSKSLLVAAALRFSLPHLALKPECCFDYADHGFAMTALRFSVTGYTSSVNQYGNLFSLISTARDYPSQFVSRLKFCQMLLTT